MRCELLLDRIFDLLNTTKIRWILYSISCELLLDRIFDLLNTTLDPAQIHFRWLWIAFGSYLWLTEHNFSSDENSQLIVVNCFWIVSLTYWTQLSSKESTIFRRCELLLDRIFDLLNTTTQHRCRLQAKLWIAFGSYLWLTEHNRCGKRNDNQRVVNCFWIVSLTYWTQPPNR